MDLTDTYRKHTMAGEDLPVHKDPPHARSKYPLRINGGHTRWSIHAIWRDHKLMLRLQQGQPVCFMNPVDCEVRGIGSGDMARVYNDIGEFEVMVKLAATTQLEFLHFFSHSEAVLCQDGIDPSNYRRAQREFLINHPGKWVPKLTSKLAANNAANFYIEITRLLLAFINHDIKHTVNQVGRGKQDIGIALTTIEEQPTKWAQETEFDESIDIIVVGAGPGG